MIKIIKQMFMNKFIRLAALVVVIVAVAISGFLVYNIHKNVQAIAAIPPETTYNFATYPTIDTTGKDAALIDRGAYLVKAGDCIACHTNSPKKGATFAGGLAFPTAFGTIYSPNITPDKTTGIGNWTQAQFNTAMRHGISPDGQYYYPAFPYYYFNHLKDADLEAIKAYLDVIPAVQQQNQANKMVFPFNFRIFQLGWRIMFFYANATGPYQDVHGQSATWNRGKFLVEGLGHCAMCHTPSYHIIDDSMSLGAPIVKYNYTGAKIQGYLAPNITKANIGGAAVEEVLNVFLKDQLIGGGNVVGPMLEDNHDSLSYLTREDLTAITLYLQTVVSAEPPKAKGGPGVATYEGYCSGCHAMGSGGAPKMGDAAAWDALTKKTSLTQIYANAIHGINGMPAKGTCNSCSEDEIKVTVDYMIHGGSDNGSAGAMLVIPKPFTSAQGQAAYQKNCSSCHDNGLQNAPKPDADLTVWQPILAQGFYDIYRNITEGRKGHPVHGGCKSAVDGAETCSDADIKAALKYMLQQSDKTKNYSLW